MSSHETSVVFSPADEGCPSELAETSPPLCGLLPARASEPIFYSFPHTRRLSADTPGARTVSCTRGGGRVSSWDPRAGGGVGPKGRDKFRGSLTSLLGAQPRPQEGCVCVSPQLRVPSLRCDLDSG